MLLADPLIGTWSTSSTPATASLHPLRERLDMDLLGCDAGAVLATTAGPPPNGPGLFRMRRLDNHGGAWSIDPAELVK